MAFTPVCQLCGLEEGTREHRLFRCPYWHEERHRSWSASTWAWLRSAEGSRLQTGIAESAIPVEAMGDPPLVDIAVSVFGEQGDFGNLVFIDGSSVLPQDPQWRRAGWSAIGVRLTLETHQGSPSGPDA
eukprot:5642528-Amphidinium_carterae.1